MTGEYCVVLGDVVDSREIDDRAAFKRALDGVLDAINERYESEIYAPFSVLKGTDEFGGVLRSVSPLADIQRLVARALHPESARMAAVVGEIDIDGRSKAVAEMDGMAFARADMILSELEAERLTFRLTGKKPEVDTLISDEINLLDIVRSEWSERQMEVVSLYERLDSQQAVADELGVSVQAVSKQLRRSDIDRVLTIERRLADTVASYPSLNTDE